MSPIRAFLEIGKRRTFAGAVDWPGWCRSGRDEATALRTLLAYGSRYAGILRSSGIGFPVPAERADLRVIERHDGNATTDFGAPAIMLDSDREPLDQAEVERLDQVLLACWRAFDSARQRAGGRELRKGPRGGGRDLVQIVDHVIEADRAYLARLAWKLDEAARTDPAADLGRTRQAIRNALEAAVQGLPEHDPRGGIIWPPRYFVRRVAWHVLDHAWEIEDRTT